MADLGGGGSDQPGDLGHEDGRVVEPGGEEDCEGGGDVPGVPGVLSPLLGQSSSPDVISPFAHVIHLFGSLTTNLGSREYSITKHTVPMVQYSTVCYITVRYGTVPEAQ